MNWYEKLQQYFPIEEMKSQEHMELLLKEKGDVYHKDEGPYHVMMYAEFPSFIFIDYLYVSKESRGQGLGHRSSTAHSLPSPQNDSQRRAR